MKTFYEQMESDRKLMEQKILKLAKDSGVENNGLFQSTFRQYQRQLKLLDELEEAIGQEGSLITKEYVKGRENLCKNPAVPEFNRTCDSANKTVSTMMKIIREFGAEQNGSDPLEELTSDVE